MIAFLGDALDVRNASKTLVLDNVFPAFKEFADERKCYAERVSALEAQLEAGKAELEAGRAELEAERAELAQQLSADTAENVELLRLRRNVRQQQVVLASLQQEFAGAQRDLTASRNALAQAARDHGKRNLFSKAVASRGNNS